MRTLIRKDVDGASGDVYFEQIAGLSTETKPTANLASGSEFFEVDTGKKFIFDETENSWIEAPSVADLKSAIQQVEDALTVETGTNYFPQITESEFVGGYYLKDGETVANDTASYVSKYIEVLPNTQYTIGLIPAYGSATLPWLFMTYAGEYYNESKTFISNLSHSSGVFTTPANAKYIRINVASGAGVSRNYVNERCMLVKGSERPSTYVQYDIRKYIVDAGNKTIELEVKEKDLEEIVDNRTLYPLDNLYDSSKQTASTISPHYFVNGEPYSSTQFDSSYNCTAMIPIEPSTKYTIGLVPAVNDVTKPWRSAGNGLFCYDADGNYILYSNTTTNTFTTPSNAKFIRFNYAIINGINLETLNARCMLVKGETLPSSYSGFGYETIKERADKAGKKVCYVIGDSGESVVLISKYNSQYDFAVTLKKKGGNNLFDFYKLGIIPNGTDSISESADTQIVLMTTETDWFAPFIVGAKNNADGDDNSQTFTGGNHQYNNQGSGSTATAETSSLVFKADNKTISDGSGNCSQFEMIWTNLVQGWNTKKSNGTGREILQENHRLIFDGVRFEFFVDLIPLEDVSMTTWYGAQWSTGSTVYPKVRYIGGEDRDEHTVASASSESGDSTCCHAIGYGDDHEIRLDIDEGYDLGNHSFISNARTDAMFTATYGKGYCYIISVKDLYEDKMYSLHGFYQFRSLT